MELAHAHNDSIIAAFLEPGTLTDVAKRVNMSLAALAAWVAEHATLLDNMHKLLLARCKLIAAHLELAALSSLAAVSAATTTTADPKLRERALERQRKAASAILRHNTRPQRTPSTSSAAHVPPNANSAAQVPRQHSSSGREGLTQSALFSTLDVANGSSVTAAPRKPTKPSLAERFAARRLATLNTA